MNSHYARMLCVKFGWNWPCGSQEDLNVAKEYFFEDTCIPFMQECFVPSLVEIGPVALEKIFKCRQCIFAVSLSISPLKRSKLYIWTNLISVHSRMIHKSIWNSTGSGADDFFRFYLHLEKDVVLNWNTFEFSLFQDYLCQDFFLNWPWSVFPLEEDENV